MNIPDLNSMPSKAYGDTYMKKHYPEFYEYIMRIYEEVDGPLKEKIYLYKHNLLERPKCPVCGNTVKFIDGTKGYCKYCCSKCSNSDPNKIQLTKYNNIKKYGVKNISQLKSIKEKKKETSLKNYGVENPSKSKEIRERVKTTILNKYGVEHPSQSNKIKEKYINTMLDKYGVEHPSQLDSVKEKKKETSLKNYGVEHPSQSNVIKEKKKETNLKNYGYESPMMCDCVKNKIKEKQIEKYKKDHPDIIDIFEDNGERFYKCLCGDNQCQLCQEKTFIIHKSLYHSRRYQNIEKCTIKNPIDHKSKDTSLELFVQNILDEYNIQYVKNNRICGNLELDIYIPSKNIGIECNGIYWHSDKIKSKEYHYNKYKLYKDNGIQVITIWEDWIKTKPEILRSILLSKLGIINNKILARQCIIKCVTSNESKDFLIKNHIQGNNNSSIRLGLYYGNELVSLMCFSKKRKNMMGKESVNDEWELTRFCNKLNTIVVGGASKLLNYFIKNNKFTKLISFASHDISNGKLYETLGFIKESEIKSSYWYVDNYFIRYHRYCFRKSELVKKGYNEKLSEFQIMDSLPYLRIYDSGQSKYILKKDLI